MSILITLLIAFVIAEFVGYFLHRLLHSDKIRWLSRSHMQHHLIDYGPTMPMRPDDIYRSGARARTNVFGLGLEWLVPSTLIIAILIVVMSLLGLSWYLQAIFLSGVIGWSLMTFNYMHDAMHRKNFWALKLPYIERWFRRVRRFHDIHHVRLEYNGLMKSNFGICFFVFDRLFGTLQKSAGPLNVHRHAYALVRYRFIYDK